MILKSLFQEIQPQSIHFHHLSGFPLDWHSIIPKDCKSILTLHDYSLPCARGQLYHRDHYICKGAQESNCAICTEPWLPFKSHSTRENLLEKRSILVQQFLEKMDVIQAPSQDLAQRFKKWYPHLDITVIDLPNTPSAKFLDWNERPLDFVFVGSILPTKAPHLAIQAFHLLKDPSKSLTIIGPDCHYPTFPNYPNHCRDLIRSNPLTQNSIQWLGALSHQETIKTIAQHKVFILPSQWPENSPLSIREADNLGLRVICSQIGGSKELLQNPLLLCGPSVAQLAELMQQAIQSKPINATTHPNPLEFISNQLSNL